MAEERTIVRPGDRNFVTDMNLALQLVEIDRCLAVVPLTPAISSPVGSASLGTLVTIADVAASYPALAACSPDWTATQDLSFHAAGWLTEGPVVVETKLVRVGKKVVIVSATAYDGGGVEGIDALRAAIDTDGTDAPPVTGRGLVAFARLPRTAAVGVDDHRPQDWVGELMRREPAWPVSGSVFERLGLVEIDPARGVLELERTPYVANSIGTINGGAQALLIERAAEAACPGLVATDAQIHYLSQVRAGPARSTVAISRRATDHAVVVVDLVDAGHDDQLLATATVTLQTPP